MKKLKREFPEPDQEELRCKKAEIVDRIRAAKESLLYLTVDPSAVGGEAEIQRPITTTTIHNMRTPTNTSTANTPRNGVVVGMRRFEPETLATTLHQPSPQSLHRRTGGNSSAESSDSDTTTTTVAALAEMMEEGSIPPERLPTRTLNGDSYNNSSSSSSSRRVSTVGRRSYVPQRRGTLQDLQDGYGV